MSELNVNRQFSSSPYEQPAQRIKNESTQRRSLVAPNEHHALGPYASLFKPDLPLVARHPARLQLMGEPKDVPLQFVLSPARYDAGTINHFSKLNSALTTNPSVLRNLLHTNYQLAESIEELVTIAETEAHSVNLLGADFLPRDFRITEQQRVWLEAHPEVSIFNTEDSTKMGRLAAAAVNHEQRDTIAEAIQSSGYTPNALHQGHIARLLTHTNAPACTNFALEVMRHMSQYQGGETEDYQSAIPGSVDGNTSAQFWTYGPYVLEAITSTGGDFNTFMNEWVLKRQSLTESYLADSKYPGIEELYLDRNRNPIPNFNYLGKDGSSLSHQMVRLIAYKAILPTISQEASSKTPPQI